MFYCSHLWICAWWQTACSFSPEYWMQCMYIPLGSKMQLVKQADDQPSPESLMRSRHTQEVGYPPQYNPAPFHYPHWCPVSLLECGSPAGLMNKKDLTLIAIKCLHWVLLTSFTYIELQCWEPQTELLEEVEVLLLPVPAVLHTCIELHYQLC